MIRRSTISLAIVVLLMTSSIVAEIPGSGDGEEGPSRAEEDFATQRCDTDFFTGDSRTELFGDVTGDGVKDAIIAAREYPPGKYHLRVIDLTDGSLVYSHDSTYENLNIKLMNVDDDPAYEIVIEDYDNRIQHSRLFIYDVETSSILFELPVFDGRYQTEILNGEFVVRVIDDPVTYTPDRTIWWEFYDMSTWTMTWQSPKFNRPTGVYLDVDNDGINEYVYSSSWLGYSPPRGNVYIVDIADHEVKLNSTEVGPVDNSGSDATQIEYFDMDDDGFYEILIHAFWEHNSTSRSYFYSAETNTLLWSTVNLSKYRLRGDPFLADVDEDGIKEISLILSEPGTEFKSKLVVLDPLNGEVLVEEIYNDRFFRSHLSAVDLNGDGNLDLFAYNETSWSNGAMTFKAYDPSGSWNKIYDVVVPDMIEKYVRFIEDTGDLMILIKGDGTGTESNKRDIRIYNQADMSIEHSFGDFDIGSAGSVYFSHYSYYGAPDIMSIEVTYDEPALEFSSQMYLANIQTGEYVYTSDLFESTVSSDMQISSGHLDNDGVLDFIYSVDWMEAAATTSVGRIYMIDGNDFSVEWTSSDYESLSSWQLNNYSVLGMGGYTVLDISHFDGGSSAYTTILWNVEGPSPVLIYEVTDSVRHNLKQIDIDLDGEYELEDRWAEGGMVHFNILDISTDPPTEVHLIEVDGTYGNTGGVYQTTDGQRFVEIQTGSSYHLITLPELVEFYSHSWSGQYRKAERDLDQDGHKEMIWQMYEDHGTYGSNNITIIDMATGDVVGELRDINYTASIFIEDLDSDRYNEIILIKELYWDDSDMWGISVYNISTDLKPELTGPISPVELVEDGPGETIALSPLFWNDGPMTFDAVDMSGDLTLELVGDSLTITPKADAFGMKKVDIIVSDEMWDVHFPLPVNISPTHDGIKLVSIDGITPINGFISLELEHERPYSLPIVVLDVDGDLDRLYVVSNWTGITANLSRMELDINLTVDVGVNTIFSLKGMDLNESPFEQLVFINITNVPHTPFDLNISSFENGDVFDGFITLVGTAKDLDIPWGDELTFEWLSNISGPIATDPSATGSFMLPAGNHTITMRVTDGYGLSANISKWVIINEVSGPYWFNDVTANMTGTGDFDLEISQFLLEATFIETEDGYDVWLNYTVSGTCFEDIEALHFYRAQFFDTKSYLMTPWIEDGSPLSLSPEDGTWEFTTSDHTEMDEIPVIYGRLGVVGWYNGSYAFTFKDITIDRQIIDINGTITDTDTDTDTDTNDDLDDKEKNSLVTWLLIGVLLLILAGVVVFFILSRKGQYDDDEE